MIGRVAPSTRRSPRGTDRIDRQGRGRGRWRHRHRCGDRQHDWPTRAAWLSSVTSPSTPPAGRPTTSLATGGKATAVGFDLADPDSVAALLDTAESTYGGSRPAVFDVGADMGAIRADTDVVDIDFDVWDRVMSVNLRGYVAPMKYAIPRMLDRGGGAIVNMSSAAAFQGEPARPAYATAKAGIGALNTSCRVEVGQGGHPVQRRGARLHRHRGDPVRSAMARTASRRAETHPRTSRRRTRRHRGAGHLPALRGRRMDQRSGRQHRRRHRPAMTTPTSQRLYATQTRR